MSGSTSSSASGVGFGSLLTVLFIGLKLTHVINWSWWWVLAPMWMSAAFAILVMLLMVLVVALFNSR